MIRSLAILALTIGLAAGQVSGQVIKFTYRQSLSWSGKQVDIWKNGETVQATVSSLSWQIGGDSASATLDTTYVLAVEQYEELGRSILSIQPSDIAKSANMRGRDGTRCTIEYGSAQNSIQYSIWSPHYKTEERGLTQFVQTCALILTTVNLKPSNYLR